MPHAFSLCGAKDEVRLQSPTRRDHHDEARRRGQAEGGPMRRDRRTMIAVYDYELGSSNVVCVCEWLGPRRYLKAFATQDAWAHPVRWMCPVSVPLVFPAMIRTKEGVAQ